MSNIKYSESEIIYLVSKFNNGSIDLINFCKNENINIYDFKKWLHKPSIEKEKVAGTIIGNSLDKESNQSEFQRSVEANNFICFKINDTEKKTKAKLIKKHKFHVVIKKEAK